MQEDAFVTHLFKGGKRYIPIVLLCLLPLFALLEQTTYAHTFVVLDGRAQQHTLQNTAVLTFHNDLFRSGQNLNETILNTNNVNSQLFGKRVSYPVDGQIYTQPLFVPNVTIRGRTYNVVYIATENDSVYAFDADQRTATAPLWHTSFIHRPAITPVPPGNVYTNHRNQDITPHIGITGTPVIDLDSGTLYVVAFTLEKAEATIAKMARSASALTAAISARPYCSIGESSMFARPPLATPTRIMAGFLATMRKRIDRWPAPCTAIALMGKRAASG